MTQRILFPGLNSGSRERTVKNKNKKKTKIRLSQHVNLFKKVNDAFYAFRCIGYIALECPKWKNCSTDLKFGRKLLLIALPDAVKHLLAS